MTGEKQDNICYCVSLQRQLEDYLNKLLRMAMYRKYHHTVSTVVHSTGNNSMSIVVHSTGNNSMIIVVHSTGNNSGRFSQIR